MHESQILSSEATSTKLEGTTPPQAALESPTFIFDACQPGVVLRAVLGVEITLAVGAIYGSFSIEDWLLQTAWLTSGGLPGTLLWLLMTCSLNRFLHRLEDYQQYSIGILLGSVAGLYATAMLNLSTPTPQMLWIANAITGGIMAAILLGYLILRSEGKTPAATKAQLIALQSHIRPHFLFNALNSAIALIKDEPNKAETLLEDLSDLFRATLQNPHSTIPLSQEIEFAKRYMSIEKIRFGDRLQVEWNLDPSTFNVFLPPLLLQPLLENAVKHGVEFYTTETKVTIVTRLIQKKNLLLIVRNTLGSYKGGDVKHAPQKGAGIALKNVQRRLFLLHDVRATFSAKHKNDLFEVRISIPTH